MLGCGITNINEEVASHRDFPSSLLSPFKLQRLQSATNYWLANLLISLKRYLAPLLF
jgi:hypothetical protein